MNLSKYKILIVLAFTFFSIHYSFSQNYRNPLDIPIVLSANWAELRNNHFHGGLDFKTQQVENKRVYSIEDGYVSRISVSPSGYGLAIYVDHPSTGHTSVYGHLNAYAPKIAEYVKEQQYAQESFAVNLYPDKKLFPLKKGDVIAYSGNTGSSGGPHVHFEIRETKPEKVLDPLVYYKSQISDNIPPEIRGVAVYPIVNKGSVNDSSNPLRLSITKSKKGDYLPLKTSIDAWGTIGVGIKAYDRMTGTSNVYGVKHVKLFLDNKEIFSSDLDYYTFDQTRMINTFADFEAWRNNKEWFMKSFVDPGNKLSFYKTINDGYVNINEEKTYSFRYVLTDIYGNSSEYEFTIIGKKQNIVEKSKCSLFMNWNKNNRYISDAFSLIIEKDNLYTDLCFNLNKSSSNTYFSDRYRVHNSPVPLHLNAKMKIKLNTDTLKNKSQYGIVQIRNGKNSWVGGNYENGFLTTNIRELGGEYAVFYDNISPKIEPLTPQKWVVQKAIKIRLSDNLSGMKYFRGTVDDRYVLFKHDVKSSVYTFDLQDLDSKIETGKNHKLVFEAEDKCGNRSVYEYEFTY